jgi:hypothetical protein
MLFLSSIALYIRIARTPQKYNIIHKRQNCAGETSGQTHETGFYGFFASIDATFMQWCRRLASVDATFAQRCSILAPVDATFTQWCRRLASVDATTMQRCNILASADATACSEVFVFLLIF